MIGIIGKMKNQSLNIRGPNSLYTGLSGSIIGKIFHILGSMGMPAPRSYRIDLKEQLQMIR